VRSPFGIKILVSLPPHTLGRCSYIRPCLLIPAHCRLDTIVTPCIFDLPVLSSHLWCVLVVFLSSALIISYFLLHFSYTYFTGTASS
jgi:hypothetical protein